MNISDVIKRVEEQSKTVPYAAFNEWLAGLSKEDRDALDSALRNGVPVAALHKALREEGVPFGDRPLYEYRKQLLRKFTG